MLPTFRCAWDGGDCCGSSVDTSDCDSCGCLDPDAKPTADDVSRTCLPLVQQQDPQVDVADGLCCAFVSFLRAILFGPQASNADYDGPCDGQCGKKFYVGDNFCDDDNVSLVFNFCVVHGY